MNRVKKNTFFLKRIPEPKTMEALEMRVFEDLSVQNYKRWIIPLADEALEHIKFRKAKILDIGTGPGLLAKEFALRSKEFGVVGIDFSPIAIKLARKNCRGLKNVNFLVGNAYQLPFPNKSFDMVLCKDTLHHFSNPKKALKEMIRVLKKDGLLYLQDLKRDLPLYLLQRSIPPDTTIKKLQFYSTRAAYTKHELKTILEELRVNNFRIRTKKLTENLRKKYKKKGIDLMQLKEGFQARYIAIVKPS